MTAAAARTASSPRNPAKASSRRRAPISLAGPKLGRDHAVLVGRRVVPCPYDGRPLQVEVNRRVDILAQERAAGRISEAEFLVGRACQAVWERQSGARMGSGAWNPGSSRDQTVAHELAILYAIDDAEKAQAFSERVASAIGWTGVAQLKLYLVEGHTFASRAGFGASHWQVGKIADRFRSRLKDLTEALHTAHGAEGQRIRATRDPA